MGKHYSEEFKNRVLSLEKDPPIDDSPMESFHGILKKETLYNNEISSIQEYKLLV